MQASVTYADRGEDVSLSASLETGLDWSPRRLAIRGQPFRGGDADLEVVIAAGRAEIRDRGATTVADVGDRLFFPIDGGLPAGLQEPLVAYWRTRGRPAEIASAPGGPIRIQSRADQQIDVGGRTVVLERLSIDGPVWGQQTAWVEPGGRLDALVTWVGGLPFQAVREGFESRLGNFIDQAIRDRVTDLDRLTATSLPEHASGVVFTGATVITAPGRPAISDATVVVRDGRIAAVGPSSRVRAPAELPAIDATGMTIVPGLWDLDGQISQIDGAAAYLAAGVTTVRHSTPDRAFGDALRTAALQRSRSLLGPRMEQAGLIDATGAGALGAVRVDTPDQAREAVRRYRSEGVRRIEVGRAIGVPLLEAVAREARRLGMTVAGRVPAGATADQAVRAGLNLLQGPLDALPDESARRDWLAALAREKTALAPEAAWQELRELGSAAPSLRAGPGATSPTLPRSLVRRYSRAAASGAGANDLAVRALVAAAHEAGVPLVPGTGLGIPGLGVLRELELFVEAGIPPAEALRAATTNAAEWMKLDDSGAVESGKRADLVVLAGNPLDDISNLRTARWVVADGRLYDCAKLWALAGFGN